MDATLAFARQVIETEAQAVGSLLSRIDAAFARAVDLIVGCRGRVVVTGMGKPGFIAQKISATFASTGTPSLYLHPAEAVHGDLGRVVKDDVLIALSNSGETEEILRLLPALRRIGAAVVAVTAHARSTLARAADVVLDIGTIEEAGPFGLAPTASSIALLAMGDALAMTVLRLRPFTPDDYASLHPGGKLGRKLMRVSDLMRTGEANPVVREKDALSRAVVVMTETPGRPGATSVVDKHGRLTGIFTDGDLRRLVVEGRTDFKVKVGAVMGRKPRTVRADEPLARAAAVMRRSGVDQLPVVDEGGRPVGMLDIQDLLHSRVIA
jgi:arabinose-5-phosphate isomerase